MTDTPSSAAPPRRDGKLLHVSNDASECTYCVKWLHFRSRREEECPVRLRLALDRAREGLEALIDTLEPAINYRGVSITLGQRDVEAIRAAIAAARAASNTEEG